MTRQLALVAIGAVVSCAIACGMGGPGGPQPPKDPLYKGPTPATEFVAKGDDASAPQPKVPPFQGTEPIPLFKR